MSYTRWLVWEVRGVIGLNRGWMAWNLLLAFVPAVLATLLFRGTRRRTLGWWLGVGVFALFLPNAPYVLTDLVHLRGSAALAPADTVVVFGVLPLYALFVWLGMSSYVYCLHLVVREVRTTHPQVARTTVELPVHALCALGIVLGRIARLNTWDTVAHPRWTAESVFNTLSWRGAPFAFFAIFLAVWGGFTVVRALWVAALGWADRRTTRWRPGLRRGQPRPTSAG